jgi:hypothetical protein
MRFLIGRGFKSAGTAGGVSRVALSVENDDGGSSLTRALSWSDAIKRRRSGPIRHEQDEHRKNLQDWLDTEGK